jgi:hypothetical protein
MIDRELTPAEIAELETEVRTGIPDTREIIREIDSSYDLRASHLGPGARETTANVTADQMPGTPFWVSSGAFSADVDTVNGKPAKVLTCQTAGVAYAKWGELRNNQSEAAYGTWDWWSYKTDTTFQQLVFISTVAAPPNDPSQNGYRFGVSTTERFSIYPYSSGSAGTQVFYGDAVEPINQWVNYKVTRSPAGVFSAYRNGALIAAAVGSNPGTDNTHTTSKYCVFDLDAGDKIALAHLDGTPLFSKYLGVV